MLATRFSVRAGVTYALLLLIVISIVDRNAVSTGAGQDEAPMPVARISLVAGQVGHRHAADGADEWYDASINLVVGEGDQICTGSDGRVEIQTDQGGAVRLGGDSFSEFSSLSAPGTRISLMSGTATFRLGSRRQETANSESGAEAKNSAIRLEISTPVVAITIRTDGIFRVNVRDDGKTELMVREGQAEVYRQDIGNIIVTGGRMFAIDGADSQLFAVLAVPDSDEWDRWNQRRDAEMEREVAPAAGYSGESLPATLPGFTDLDRYGQWQNIAEYGRVWTPSGVGGSWAPYRLGYWRWYAAYGWTWVSHEPWGWLPYHYGRWTWHRERWYWVPIGGTVVLGRPAPSWRWSPHLVAFFGWGDNRYANGYRQGFSDGYWTGYRDGRGWIGWCPLAPGESREDRRPAGVALRNYGSPGGASLLESRRFIENRLVRIGENLTAPPRNRNGELVEVARPVREENLRPSRQSVSTRPVILEQPDVRRRISTVRPLITGRSVVTPARTVPTRVDSNSWRSAFERGFQVRPSRTAEPIVRSPAASGSSGTVRPERTITTSPRRNNSGVEDSRQDRPLRVTVPSGSNSIIYGRQPVAVPRSDAPRRESRPPSTTIDRQGSAPPSHTAPPRAASPVADSPSRPGRTIAPDRNQDRPPAPRPHRSAPVEHPD